MKNSIKVILIVFCCLLVCGCSNVKVIKEQQLSEDEVVKFVTKSLNEKYDDLEIKLDKVEKAYTFDNELIKNGKYYYFKITDKDGNKAYASYMDAFKVGEELFGYSYIESYKATYNNKELDYYKYLAETYVDKDEIIDCYYASDYKNEDYASRAKIVYELNYKLKDMTLEQYADLLKLGYDLRKYRLEIYGVITQEDPEVFLIFKDSKKYYYVSYYGLVEDGGTKYDMKVDLNDNYTDSLNLNKFITFNITTDEYNKMINKFNSIGVYLIDEVGNINVKSDDKYAYVLIDNKTKNGYYLGLLFKFKFNSKDNSFVYEKMSLIDSNTIGNYDGFAFMSW